VVCATPRRIGAALLAIGWLVGSAAAAAAAGPVVGWGRTFPPVSPVEAVEAGYAGGCAIEAGSGAVACWGDPHLAPPPSVDGTQGTAVALSVASYPDAYACAIQAGTNAVVCWGDDTYGQADPPSSVDGTTGTAAAVAAGDFHTCAIQAITHAVVCWGRSDAGALLPPVWVDGTQGTATALAAGGGYTLALAAPEPDAGLLGLASLAALLAAAHTRRRARDRSASALPQPRSLRAST
jgi:hypothetical protein